MRTLIAVTTLVACLWGATRARADAPTDLDALLALKPTPGVEALLLAHARDPRVVQRWVAALADADPDRRTAAARVIGLASVREALPALTAAMATERDPIARDEIARTLAIIGTEASDRLLLERLDEVPGAALRIVTTLAALRPVHLVAWVSEGGRLGADHNRASDRAAAIQARLVATSPELATRLEAAADSLAIGTVQGLLHFAHSTARRVPADLVIAGFRGDARTAGEALTWLPVVEGPPRSAREDAALVDAYRRLRAAMPTGRDSTHDVLLGLSDRWLLAPDAAMPALTNADADTMRVLQLPSAVFAVVSEQERRALALHMKYEGAAATELVEAAVSAPSQPLSWASVASHRMLTEVPAAMVVDLQRLIGCKSRERVADQPAVITYRPDGRPQTAELNVSAMPAACARLAQVLVSTAYGPMPPPDQSRVFTVLRLQPSWWACLADHQASRRVADLEVRPIRGLATPPEAVERVKAVYPPGARERREEGKVLLEMVISATGCVADASVIRSVPSLNLAALQSVSYWRFRPGRLEGRPVPVTATIEVAFSLREP